MYLVLAVSENGTYLGKSGADVNIGWALFLLLFLLRDIWRLGHQVGGEHFIDRVADGWQGALRSLPACICRWDADRWGRVWRNGDGCRGCADSGGDRRWWRRRLGCSMLGGPSGSWSVVLCSFRLLGADRAILWENVKKAALKDNVQKQTWHQFYIFFSLLLKL